MTLSPVLKRPVGSIVDIHRTVAVTVCAGRWAVDADGSELSNTT